jgi:CDP-diacylglycerol--serine O-phosphatidyltransferase
VVVVLGLVIIFCLLMVSEIPMFSLKFKHYKWKGNEYPYLLIILTLLLVIRFSIFGISLAIACYIFLSLLRNRLSLK